VQWYLGPEGDQRVWYESDEIERIAEDELRRAGLMPSIAEPVTDIERFIEVYLKAELDQFAELPAGVLGLTRFTAGRPPAIAISKQLTESRDAEQPEPGMVGRWRATLAHEAAHVLLHRYLFDPDMAQLVGGHVSDAPLESSGLMRCLHRDVMPVNTQDWSRVRRHGDWREIQANRAMAALLMPGLTFKRVASQQTAKLGLNGISPGSSSTELLAAAMADVFNVSKQAATIRLGTLQVVASA